MGFDIPTVALKFFRFYQYIAQIDKYQNRDDE